MSDGMQENELNKELQRIAGDFRMEPNSVSFAQIKATRQAARIKRRFIRLVSAAAIIVAGVWFGYNISVPSSSWTQPLITESSSSVARQQPSIENPQHDAPATSQALQGKAKQTIASEDVLASYEQKQIEINKKSKQKGSLPVVVKNQKIAVEVREGQQAPLSNSVPELTPVAISAVPKMNRNSNQNQPIEEIAEQIEKSKSNTVAHHSSGQTLSEGTTTDTTVKLVEAGLTSNGTPQNDSQSLIMSPKHQQMFPKREIPSQWVIEYTWSSEIAQFQHRSGEAAPDWSSRYLNTRSSFDQTTYCYRLGANLERKTDDHFSFGAGLFISGLSFTERKNTNEINPGNLATAYPLGNLKIAYDSGAVSVVGYEQVTNHFTYIELPLTMTYRQQWKNLQFYARGGIHLQQLAIVSAYAYDGEDSLNVHLITSASHVAFNQQAVQLSLSAMIGYQFRKNWFVVIGPSYRYGISSLYSKSYLIKQTPSYSGVNLALQYHF